MEEMLPERDCQLFHVVPQLVTRTTKCITKMVVVLSKLQLRLKRHVLSQHREKTLHGSALP